MDTQFGLAHVWSQGDGVTRTVAVVLLVMSLASWLVILVKLLDLRRHRQQARACAAFWQAADFEEGLRQLGTDPDNPFRHLAEAGHQATHHLQRPHEAGLASHGNGNANATPTNNAAGHEPQPQPQAQPRPHLHEQLDVSDWVTRELRNGIDEFTARLQSGLAVLASVGSTAPFVGLFGTVWGIYHALLGIGAAGQATIDKVAGPIGEALIMTALGLAVAIPAVLGYNALVRGNKGVLHQLNRFGHDLHALFVTGARVGRRGG